MLSKKFSKHIKENLVYREAKSIVLTNSEGNIWLVGGAVFRNLAYLLYKTEVSKCDFDFLIEKIKAELIIPSHWKIGENHFSDTKLLGPDYNIDFIPLARFDSLENYLKQVPLTVQSIAYNIDTDELIGKIGIKSLYDKKVGINNLSEANRRAKIYEKTLKEIIEEKAQNLEFISDF